MFAYNYILLTLFFLLTEKRIKEKFINMTLIFSFCMKSYLFKYKRKQSGQIKVIQYLFSSCVTSVAFVSVYENDTMAKGQAALGDLAVSLLPSFSSS